MQDFSIQTVVFVSAICLFVGLIIGFLVCFIVNKSRHHDFEKAQQGHEQYRDEVREHFEQTSQIMSKIVDDYRQLYQHVSQGAGDLANIYPERVITPPPSPEAITQKDHDQPAKPHLGTNQTAAEKPKAGPAVTEQISTPQPDKKAPGLGDNDDLDETQAAAMDPRPSLGREAPDSQPQEESIEQRARRLSGRVDDKNKA